MHPNDSFLSRAQCEGTIGRQSKHLLSEDWVVAQGSSRCLWRTLRAVRTSTTESAKDSGNTGKITRFVVVLGVVDEVLW